MPGIGGLITLEKIMEWKAVRVIILSTHSSKDTQMTIEALYRGAVDFVDKQRYSLMDFDSLRKVLLEKIFQVGDTINEKLRIKTTSLALPSDVANSFDVLLIGASTGGPRAIQQVLEDIGSYLPIPVAVVQHMPEGFIKPFADRLNAHLPFHVREAPHADLFQPGSVYIGPTGFHLRLKKKEDQVYTILTKYPENAMHRPSVDVLFHSASQVYGRKALALLLTGMGKDGAQGMAELANVGAYTIAQDEFSCTVYGMPRAAVELGGAREILNIGEIGKRVVELLNHRAVLSRV
jgi:two-component system chemotaxis response regulator CheB